jgi:hypothetical protein
MKFFAIIILSLVFIQDCTAQKKLPKEMPNEITISFYSGGGMAPEYKNIRIVNGLLNFEELRGIRQGSPQKWSVKVSHEDLKNLYKVFVENKVDEIKNEKPKWFVSDAGSERISISLTEFGSFEIMSGKNHPLSEKNLERFYSVKKAILDLVEKYQNQKDTSQNIDEAEKFIQGKWRVAGESGIRAWFLEWTFDNGNFKNLGYPPISQEGKYKILSVNSDKITLEFYDQKGNFGTENTTKEILIDRKADRLTISNTNGFARVVEKKID